MGDNFRSNSLARKRQTTQYNTAELIQPRQNMAAPMHRGRALEKVVTRQSVARTMSRPHGAGGHAVAVPSITACIMCIVLF